MAKKPKKTKPQKSMKMKMPLAFVLDELSTEMSLEIDVPGTFFNDLIVTVEDGEVHLVGKRQGVPFGQRFKFNLLKYDPETVDAELENGVLQITMDARPTVGIINVPVSVISGSSSGSM